MNSPQFVRRMAIVTYPPGRAPVELRRYTAKPCPDEIVSQCSASSFPCELVTIRIPAHSMGAPTIKTCQSKLQNHIALV